MRKTFSDNWYRIAGLRIGLRPGVSIRLHHYRGEPWYVLHERAHSGFSRVNPATYRFISRITPDLTVDEVWRIAVNEAPEETPGQEETFELISALYKANLIYIEGGVDETKIVERFERKKKKPLANRISEILFFRIPIWDPAPWLHRRQQMIDRLYSKPMLFLALALFAWAVTEFLMAGSRAWTQAQDILQLSNLIPLYLAIFFTHMLHELSHAMASRRFGGDVRTMGLMFLLFTPLPYVDLSSNWSFRNRNQRAFVGAAGMTADVFTGSIATIIWAYSPPGLVNEIAYNVMFTTATYTLLFNINPLMRFDGYYILSDLIEVPNLHEQSREQFMRFWRVKVLAQPDTSEYISERRQMGLVAFFLASNVYRMVIMLGIVLFVADQYFGLGLLVACALAFTAFIQPVQKWIGALKSPLFRYQQRRLLHYATLGGAAALAIVLFVPLPESRVLDGVLEAKLDTPIHAQSGGIVQKVYIQSGEFVKKGQLIAELINPELDSELQDVSAQLRATRAQEAMSVTAGGVDLEPILERVRTLQFLEDSLRERKEQLRVVAPHDGIWSAPELKRRIDSWVGRGAELGRVVDDRAHVFSGIIRQEEAVSLSASVASKSWIRVEGQRNDEYRVKALTLVPHSQKKLPSAALGPAGGGGMAVRTADPSATEAAEQFFMLRAELLYRHARDFDMPLLAGRTGWIKVRVPARPLASRIWQASSQFLQRRYGL